MSDFLDVARQQLATLQDEDEPPVITSHTTSPLDLVDMDDDPFPLAFDEDGLLLPDDDGLLVPPVDGLLVLDEAVPMLPDLGDATSGNTHAARDVIPEAGIDMLAFYKSFRFVDQSPFKGRWGIFLIDAGVAAVAAEFQSHTPALPAPKALRLAARLLYEHERYHFFIDAWALSQECVPDKPKLKRYEYYISRKHGAELSPDDIEESLANGFAFRRVTRTNARGATGAAAMVREFLGRCPDPYSKFDLGADERRDAEGLLAGSVLSGLSPSVQRLLQSRRGSGDRELYWVLGQNLRADVRLYPLSQPALCPTYFVRDPKYALRVQFFQAPDRSEFRRFVEAYLSGEFIRRTDHEFFRIDNGETVKFPNPHDKTIKLHERRNILYKAGMRDAEYRRERNITKVWKENCPRSTPKLPLAET